MFVGFAAKAGFLSGFSGLESVPGPELPQIDFLNRLNGMVLISFFFPPCDDDFMICDRKRKCREIYVCCYWLCFAEENQKKYAENDARFRESPLLKKLLERSKLNKEK